MTLIAESIAPVAEPDPVASVRRESIWEQRIYFIAAIALAILFCVAIFRSYWVPAHSGTDQNGYLVGGKNFANTLTMRYAPVAPGDTKFDPHQFVGRMWVGAGFGTEQQRYYPKYPLGYPLLIAIALWIGGAKFGVIFAYAINPIASGLTLIATFLLLRRLVNSFWAFVGTAVTLSSPMLMGLSTNPNSHATAGCCVVWGIYLLLRWWQRGGLVRASLAGFLLGYAATIRYTEGLLVLPLAVVVLLNWRAWKTGWAAVLGWCAPVGVLVSYNLAAMGHVTGYDGTHESSGFSLTYAADNWDTLLRQMASIGLYGLFPISLIGIPLLVWKQWRIGLVIAAWLVPPLALYIAYYWAPDPLNQNGAYLPYLRFFATLTPGLVLTAVWVFDQVCRAAPYRMIELCCGVLALLPIAVQLNLTGESAESDSSMRQGIAMNADHVLASAPAGSVIFAVENNQTQVLHHLQFVGDYVLYSGETFNKGFIDSLLIDNPDDPQTWDPSIRQSLHDRLGKFSQQQLDEQARQIISMSLRANRRVFFLLSRRDNDSQVRARRSAKKDPTKITIGGEGGAALTRFAPESMYESNVIDTWSTPAPVSVFAQPGRGQHMKLTQRPRPADQRWQLVEITEKPPPPPAPVKAASKPTTKEK